MDAANPPNNPFSTIGNDDSEENEYDITNHGGGDDPSSIRNDFDAFSLYASSSSGDGGGAPSLQSIQQQEQLMIMRQQQQQQPSFANMPSPHDDLSGPMDNNIATTRNNNINNWPPPPSSTTAPPSSTTSSNIHEPSFLSNLLTCGIIPHLLPYFDVDTSDVYLRMKATLQYCLVNDGFRNHVLYSVVNPTTTGEDDEDSGVEMATTTDSNEASSTSSSVSTETSTPAPGISPSTIATTSTHKKIGPDLYGPTWITLTLVFFVAVTSNMSLYLHHYHHHQRQVQLNTIVDEGGVAAEEEWEYDINQLLRATSILYSFSFGLPTVLYLLLRLMGGGGNHRSSGDSLGLADLICLYGYSLVPYLPATWICIAPYNWVQWSMLAIATFLSGMVVLRNVVGSILVASSSRSTGGGDGTDNIGGGGRQGKSGGLIMCLVGCHLVFFFVMKLAFYHHQ